MPLSPRRILPTLKRLYPDARCTLDFSTPFELLVATILATQCTDARVNIVTKSLFIKYRSPADFVAVSRALLERDIRSTGSFRVKARAIQETCATLLRDFHGEVPRTMEEMITLRGVGRKIASVVLSTAFGIVEGIPVDTHVTRLAHRMGLSEARSQHRIEMDLMSATPKKEWTNLSHYLVFHGRAVCKAPTPRCDVCHFRRTCPSSRIHTSSTSRGATKLAHRRRSR
ncbi:MAG: endonuclease III [Candidatus Peribacteraceae bacterium]